MSTNDSRSNERPRSFLERHAVKIILVVIALGVWNALFPFDKNAGRLPRKGLRPVTKAEEDQFEEHQKKALAEYAERVKREEARRIAEINAAALKEAGIVKTTKHSGLQTIINAVEEGAGTIDTRHFRMAPPLAAGFGLAQHYYQGSGEYIKRFEKKFPKGVGNVESGLTLFAEPNEAGVNHVQIEASRGLGQLNNPQHKITCRLAYRNKALAWESIAFSRIEEEHLIGGIEKDEKHNYNNFSIWLDTDAGLLTNVIQGVEANYSRSELSQSRIRWHSPDSSQLIEEFYTKGTLEAAISTKLVELTQLFHKVAQEPDSANYSPNHEFEVLANGKLLGPVSKDRVEQVVKQLQDFQSEWANMAPVFEKEILATVPLHILIQPGRLQLQGKAATDR